MTVTGDNFQQAQQQASQMGWKPSMGTFGGDTGPDVLGVPYSGQPSGGGGGNGGGGGSTVTSQSLDAQFQKMLQALASGNKEAFEEAKRQFNVQFDEAKRQYDLNRSDALDQFAKNFGLSAAQITGTYNGQPTESAREFDQTLQSNLGTTLLDAATKLRGPQDYLQYQQYTRGGQNLYQQLTGNEPIPQTGAPTGPLQSVNIQSVLRDLGILPSTNGQPAPAPGTPAAPVTPTPAVPAPVTPTPVAPVPATPTYGGYDLNRVAEVLQARSAAGQYPFDAARFWALMNDTSNPSSLNYALQQATGGRVGTIDALGPIGTGPGIAVAQPAPLQAAAMDIINQPAAAPVQAPAQYSAQAVYQTPIPQQPQQQTRQAGIDQNALLSRYGLQAGQSLNPNQVNPARWDAMGQIGRDLTKNLAETYFGYDPTDFERQINATRPLGQAPRVTRQAYARPTGLF